MNAKIACPDCGRTIALAEVDVAADVARCRACTRDFGLADLFRRRDMPGQVTTQAPTGVWHRKTQSGFELGASMRSGRSWFFSIFTLIMIGMTYGLSRLIGLPVFSLAIFGIGCAVLAVLTLVLVVGSVRVRVNDDHSELAVGFSVFSLVRKFRWSTVTQARRVDSNTVENGVRLNAIQLDGAEGLPQFGSWLTPARLEFVLITLQNELHRRGRQSARPGR